MRAVLCWSYEADLNYKTRAARNQVLSLNGTSYGTFQGIQFQNDNYTLPNGTNGGYASVQRDPLFNYAGTITQNSPSAMVGCYPCTHVTFNLDIFTQTSASALEFFDAPSNDTVENSLFYDICASGINLHGFAQALNHVRFSARACGF